MKRIFLSILMLLVCSVCFAESFQFKKVRQLLNNNIELTYVYNGKEISIDMSKTQWASFLQQPNDELTVLRIVLKAYLKNDPTMTTVSNLLNKTLSTEATLQ